MSSLVCSTAPFRLLSVAGVLFPRTLSINPATSHGLSGCPPSPQQSHANSVRGRLTSCLQVSCCSTAVACQQAKLCPRTISLNGGKLLRTRQVATELRKAVVEAQRLEAKTGDSRVTRSARASAYGSTGSASRRSESVCPSCFMAHAGECA
jgi:hypothetical protein